MNRALVYSLQDCLQVLGLSFEREIISMPTKCNTSWIHHIKRQIKNVFKNKFHELPVRSCLSTPRKRPVFLGTLKKTNNFRSSMFFFTISTTRFTFWTDGEDVCKTVKNLLRYFFAYMRCIFSSTFGDYNSWISSFEYFFVNSRQMLNDLHGRARGSCYFLYCR